MSLSDKIIELFKEHTSLSTRNVKKLLKEKYDISRTQRTIQRHIQKLVAEGTLIPNKPLGREQTYSLKTDKPDEKREVTAYLIKRFWREEEEIEKECLFGNQLRAYQRARFLIMKFPKEYRNKLLTDISELDEELKKAESGDPLITYLKQESILKSGKGMGLLLIKISDTLHEMEDSLKKG